MRRGVQIVCGALLVLLLLVAALNWHFSPRKAGTNFDNYPRLAAGVVNATKVELYEGLPHHVFEESLLEQELRAKQTLRLYGYPFYTDLLGLKSDDAAELTRLFTDSSSFEPFNTAKKCDGLYHPDYAIRWHTSEGPTHCLVCFGCSEVQIFGPRGELYCDFTRDGCDKFKMLLQRYRKNRPEPQVD